VRSLTVLLAPLLAAGCALGAEDTVVAPGNAKRLVLQRADLPGFQVDSQGGGPEQWSARYRRSGGTPLGIESKAEVAESAEAAEERLAELRQMLDDRGADWQPIGEPGLGDESLAFTRVHEAARSYEIVWRDANVTCHLSVSGADRELAFADVIALAEKQERRIDDAMG
jgi:hypothetical protein